MARIAKRGYLEVPSRLEEQSWGVEGPYVGWRHHHWLVDVTDSGLEFTFKPHDLHSNPEYHFPAGFHDSMTAEERVSSLWWEGSFSARERIAYFEGGDACYAGFVSEQMSIRGFHRPQDTLLQVGKLRRAVSRLRG
jgi:hypothetical protein